MSSVSTGCSNGNVMTAANAAVITPTDITLKCSDGMTLAGQRWKSPIGTTTDMTTEPSLTTHHNRRSKILCVHGWMDNCRSYHYFAPQILQQQQHQLSIVDDMEIVTIDLPGHGWSSHKSMDGPPIHITDYVYYIAEVLQQLQWFTNPCSFNRESDTATGTSAVSQNGETTEQIILVGHSMGAAICCMYAATFPEQIHKLVLLEGAGPMTRPGQEFTKHLRENITQRQKQQQPPSTVKPLRIYPTLHQAITTRMLTVKKFPGQQYISEMAARELVVRGTKAIHEGNENEMIIGYQFRHDPRLQLPSIQYCTEEQVMAMYTNIQCPIALVLAQDGWPMSSSSHNNKKQQQQEIMIQEYMKPKVFTTLPGSHHFHADPDTAAAVVDVVVNFLYDTK